MSDEDISYLIRTLNNKYGLDIQLAWANDNTFRKVTRIAKNSDEPSLCAYFDNNEYVALYNCNISDFIEYYYISKD